jgi:hypothetical protein
VAGSTSTAIGVSTRTTNAVTGAVDLVAERADLRQSVSAPNFLHWEYLSPIPTRRGQSAADPGVNASGRGGHEAATPPYKRRAAIT